MLYGNNICNHKAQTARKPLSASIAWLQLYIKNPKIVLVI